MRIHPAPRVLTRVGMVNKNHPCAFEGPAATIAAYTRQVCPEHGTRNRRPIDPTCAAARAWRNMSRADELLLSSTGGAQISPEQLGCARRMPTSVTTTFWAASWVPRFLEDRNRSRQASRVQPKVPVPAVAMDVSTPFGTAGRAAEAHGQAHADTPASANAVLAVTLNVSTPVYDSAGRAAECRHLLSRRAAAPSQHEMNDVTILLARLALGIPFSYVHFNEGEVRAALHAAGAVPNGAQRFSPALREAMRAAMNASHPNLYAGVPCRAEFPREHLSALQLVSTESARRTAATVFINGNFPLLMTAKGGLFVDLLRRRAQGGHSLHLVASEAADVARFSAATRLVPKTVVRTPKRDSFARRDNVSREALSQFGDGDIVIVCTGALGRILVTEWTRLRPQTTFLELGSFFDPEFGFRALAYHRQVRGGRPWAPGCGSKHDRTATSMAPLQQCLKLYTGAA